MVSWFVSPRSRVFSSDTIFGKVRYYFELTKSWYIILKGSVNVTIFGKVRYYFEFTKSWYIILKGSVNDTIFGKVRYYFEFTTNGIFRFTFST